MSVTGPLTEPESLALYNYTLAHDFKLILSYHTQGEIIYWRYLDFEPVGAEELGKEFARISTYTLDDEKETNSYPGYTFETGIGQNPLPISQFEKIYKDNIGVLVTAAVKI